MQAMTATLASMPTKPTQGDDDDMAAFEGGIADTGTPVTASLADARSRVTMTTWPHSKGASPIPARRSPPVWPMHVPSASVSWSSSRPAMPMPAGTCQDRALYERAHRAAKALEATYTVAGWRQGDGQLWMPNLLVRVREPVRTARCTNAHTGLPRRSKPRIRSPAGVKVMDNCGCRTCSCVCATR